ncbi:MAG: hypothetical protein AAGF12_23925 [Myxococcota bacterium]
MKIDTAKRDLLNDDEGAVYVEYLVIVVLIGIAAIAAWFEWREAVRNDAANEYQSFGYPPS